MKIFTMSGFDRPLPSISPCVCLLLALFLFGCQPQRVTPSQPTQIGQVTSADGYPEVIRKNRKYILDTQSKIYTDDVLNTDKRSKVLITMADGSTFALGPDTHFVLHRYDLKPDETVSEADMTITSGSLKANLTSTEPRSGFEIRTPVAIINTTGGAFWSGFSFADNTLDIAMLDGKRLVIRNSHGSTQLSENAWGTSVIGDSAPQPAKAWSKQKLAQALSETNL